MGAVVLLTLQVKKQSQRQGGSLHSGHPGRQGQSRKDFSSPVPPSPPPGFLCETFRQPAPHQVFIVLPVKGQAIPIR